MTAVVGRVVALLTIGAALIGRACAGDTIGEGSLVSDRDVRLLCGM
jgi:hypothetical protein